MQRYSFFGNKHSLSDKWAWFLGKICLNYARNGDFMPSSQEKSVPLQGDKPKFIWNGIKDSGSGMYCIRLQGDA